jgi:hypothetical protein
VQGVEIREIGRQALENRDHFAELWLSYRVQPAAPEDSWRRLLCRTISKMTEVNSHF